MKSIERDLRQFTGESLQIIDEPVLQQDGSMVVTLAGAQVHDEFLGSCRNDPQSIIVTARRLLMSNNLGITLLDTVDVEGDMLQVRARISPLDPGVGTDVTGSLQKGMFIGTPHHVDGAQPLDRDRIGFAIACGVLTLGNDHFKRVAPLAKDATAFQLNGQPGEFRYYLESGNPVRRLHHQPATSDKLQPPDWRPTHQLHEPGSVTAVRIHGIKAPFYKLMSELGIPGNAQTLAADSPDGTADMWAYNDGKGPSTLSTIPVRVYDRRRPGLILPAEAPKRATQILTHSYDSAVGFLERLEHFAWQQPEKRPTALVSNVSDIQEIMRGFESPWVCTEDPVSMTMNERARTHRHGISSSLLEQPSQIVQEGHEAPIIRLLRRAGELGKDGNCLLATQVYPSHAVLDAMIADETQQFRKFSAMLFRHASLDPKNGEHFSLHDANALRSLLARNVQVYWAHPSVTRLEDGDRKAGALLKLALLRKPIRGGKQSSSLMFVPPEREQEFLEGCHIAIYGTAGTLEPRHAEILTQIFDSLGGNEKLKGKLVVHTGGGPDTSTMGVANAMARKHGMLSVGHPIFVPQEGGGTQSAVQEPVGSNLDAVMPYRNEVRGVRQMNMASAADIVWCTEGGAGSREERGISQADLGLLREHPFPIILQGVSFYIQEYLQYLMEVAEGTLSTGVIDAISLTDDPQDCVDIITAYVTGKKVIARLPPALDPKNQGLVDAFARKVGMDGDGVTLAALILHVKKLYAGKRPFRMEAWKHKET